MNCNFRTDLALESIETSNESLPFGVTKEISCKNGIEVTKVSVLNESAAKIIGKPIGQYFTVNVNCFGSPYKTPENEISVISKIISSLIYIKKDKPILLVGLGNKNITPDALGPLVIEKSLATRHLSKSLCESLGLLDITSVAAIAPGVMGQTGIESAESVDAIVKKISPSCVIVIDALAAKSLERLTSTVQISDTGISPGSGVQNKRAELSKSTLNIPVVSVGVPTVIDINEAINDLSASHNISPNKFINNMIVTPRDIDTSIDHAASVVALAINSAIQPTLTPDEIAALTS